MKTDPKTNNAFRAPSHPEQSTDINHDLYTIVTNQVIGALGCGVVPWRTGISLAAGVPRNLETQRPYRGLNILLLSTATVLRGFRSPYWLTFRQAKARGGTVRAGEAATLVVFWKRTLVRDQRTGDEKEIPVLRYYRLFNLDQCHGIQAPKAASEETSPFQPIAECERIVRDYVDGPTMEHEGSQPYYLFSTDKVVLPSPERFSPPEEYYATLFHELIHSTGHKCRLNRTFEPHSERVRTPAYVQEELIAEMGAAFLCAHAHIAPAVIQNQVAYVEGWLQIVANDRRMLVSAASAAQKAADWVLGARPAGEGHKSVKRAAKAASALGELKYPLFIPCDGQPPYLST